jgi:hypothetical protein
VPRNIAASCKKLLIRPTLWQYEPLGRLIAAESNWLRSLPRPDLGLLFSAASPEGSQLKFEVVLVSKNDLQVIGEADNAERALDLMDEAMRLYPDGHIRVRCRTGVFAERLPPQTRQR